jgi:hypothetical protein
MGQGGADLSTMTVPEIMEFLSTANAILRRCVEWGNCVKPVTFLSLDSPTLSDILFHYSVNNLLLRSASNAWVEHIGLVIARILASSNTFLKSIVPLRFT